MGLSKDEIRLEEKRLEKTIEVIRGKISVLGQELYDREDKVLEFKKFLWDSKSGMDVTEMKSMMAESDLEVSLMQNKGRYLQKLFRVQGKPYFGSIVFEDEEEKEEVYIGITHVEDNLSYYVHDWRSPICSMFYDFETGPAYYMAPMGKISGNILRKRQYNIDSGKLVHVFDNSINIDDELLQEVLAMESSDKMKNIVNTIQQEQNRVIRNTEDKNLIVQGIAGSGKTSVALHRIAFLLYKIPYLNSSSVLIFSPNNIFSEYISNVLPELGEENTLQTTFDSFLKSKLLEFKDVESFTAFVERYYKSSGKVSSLILYKQSDDIIKDIDDYVKNLTSLLEFKEGIVNRDFCYSKEELDEMFNKYSHFPIMTRIETMASKICDWNFDGKMNKKSMVRKLLMDDLSCSLDYKDLYKGFYKSNFCGYKYLSDKKINEFVSKGMISYEDACLFVYMKSLVSGFDYNTSIKEVVIDEAQDYTRLQYILLKKLFRNSNFTILGDVNQTINPYYKYDSLDSICDIFGEGTKYLELMKTYRSSGEIIEYTNRILGLNYVSAIRRENHKPVLFRNSDNLMEKLLLDLEFLKKDSKSIAIIVKNDDEALRIYDLLKDKMDVVKITNSSMKFCRDLVVIPSYLSKGLEFDSVIVYNDRDNVYKLEERYLYYVACTRCQHQLIIYNAPDKF